MKTKNLLIVIFCFVASISLGQIKGFKSMMSDAKEKDAAAKEASKTERDREQEAYFEGRPEKAGSEMAATKENVIPKKESFSDKVARYEKEGFKMGVNFSSGVIMTKAMPVSGSSSTKEQKSLKGYLPSMKEEFKVVVEDFVSKMNETFNTDIFELVDTKKIPLRTVLGANTDDWWPTIYKTVFAYNLTPEFDYNFSMGKNNGDFVAHIALYATEYYEKKGKPKMSIILNGAKTPARYVLEYSEEESFEISTIQELNAIVNPPSAPELAEILLEKQEAGFVKIKEKLNK